MKSIARTLLNAFFVFVMVVGVSATVSAGTNDDHDTTEKTQLTKKKSLLTSMWAEAKRQVTAKEYRTRNVLIVLVALFAGATMFNAYAHKSQPARLDGNRRLGHLSGWLWRGGNHPFDFRGNVFGYRLGTPQDDNVSMTYLEKQVADISAALDSIKSRVQTVESEGREIGAVIGAMNEELLSAEERVQRVEAQHKAHASGMKQRIEKLSSQIRHLLPGEHNNGSVT